jgi:hypothetical protein
MARSVILRSGTPISADRSSHCGTAASRTPPAAASAAAKRRRLDPEDCNQGQDERVQPSRRSAATPSNSRPQTAPRRRLAGRAEKQQPEA